MQNRDTDVFQIVYTLNLSKSIQQYCKHRTELVYCRKFEDLLDGVAHKLLLEELSAPSIKRFVEINKSRK